MQPVELVRCYLISVLTCHLHLADRVNQGSTRNAGSQGSTGNQGSTGSQDRQGNLDNQDNQGSQGNPSYGGSQGGARGRKLKVSEREAMCCSPPCITSPSTGSRMLVDEPCCESVS